MPRKDDFLMLTSTTFRPNNTAPKRLTPNVAFGESIWSRLGRIARAEINWRSHPDTLTLRNITNQQALTLRLEALDEQVAQELNIYLDNIVSTKQQWQNEGNIWLDEYRFWNQQDDEAQLKPTTTEALISKITFVKAEKPNNVLQSVYLISFAQGFYSGYHPHHAALSIMADLNALREKIAQNLPNPKKITGLEALMIMKALDWKEGSEANCPKVWQPFKQELEKIILKYKKKLAKQEGLHYL